MAPVLKKRDTMPLRGALVRPDRAEHHLQLRRYEPSAALRPWVSHYWFIDWALDAPYTQKVVPLPAVNLVATVDGWHATGVVTRASSRTLVGAGAVYGIHFRPAGFSAFFSEPLSTITDQTIDFAARVGRGDGLFATLSTAEHDDARVHVLDHLLIGLEPRGSDEGLLLNTIVDHAAAHRQIVRAEQLAAHFGLGVRALQRRLRRYVGIGPKQIILRFRIQDALDALAHNDACDQADLALRLGYSDQAHFVRDFSRWVGESPSAYRARVRGPG